jgi:hypothetical protein
MFEWPIDAIAGAWNYLQTVGQDLINGLILWAATVRTEIASFNPTQRIVLWIQFGVGILTIIWIIFQFAWLRRLNEARLERHLEETITTERDDLADADRSTGQITEAEYQHRRRLILENKLDEAGYGANR